MAFLGHVQKKNFKVKKCKICTQLSSEAARMYTVYTNYDICDMCVCVDSVCMWYCKLCIVVALPFWLTSSRALLECSQFVRHHFRRVAWFLHCTLRALLDNGSFAESLQLQGCSRLDGRTKLAPQMASGIQMWSAQLGSCTKTKRLIWKT